MPDNYVLSLIQTIFVQVINPVIVKWIVPFNSEAYTFKSIEIIYTI